MRTRSRPALFVYWPLLWFPIGLVVSVLRFRADDPLGGLAACLAAVLLTIVSAARAADPTTARPQAAPPAAARRAAAGSAVRS